MFYAVAKGRIPGIYRSWKECEENVKKFKFPKYRKFKNRDSAIEFIKQHNPNFTFQTSTLQKSIVTDFFNTTKPITMKKTEKPEKKHWRSPIVKITKHEKEYDYYVYTDGSCINNGSNKAKAGIGIYFGEDDFRNVSERVIGKQTNNIAALLAIIKTHSIIKDDLNAGKKICIVSDSLYSLKCIGDYGYRMSKNNWKKDIPNKNLVRKIFELYGDEKRVMFKHINSHITIDDIHSKGNDMADKLANKALGVVSKSSNRVYLNVKYSEKDECKLLGGKWDHDKKKWYTLSNNVHYDRVVKKYR